MNTTVDAKLVGKLIHADCAEHHCRQGKEASHKTSANGQPHPTAPIKERSPPEFLHCGFWPRPLTLEEVNRRNEAKPAESKKEPEGPVRVYPYYIPDIDGEDSDWEIPERDRHDESDEDDMAITPAKPLRVTWDDFSDAVETIKLAPNTYNRDDDWDGEEKVKPPYSVLKLVARHGNGSSSNDMPPLTLPTHPKPPARQMLFDQEIHAECQARRETAEYLDNLADRGEFEEGYGCVWPLEDYRRGGWAKEMVSAYADECVEFVKKVREQVERRIARGLVGDEGF